MQCTTCMPWMHTTKQYTPLHIDGYLNRGTVCPVNPFIHSPIYSFVYKDKEIDTTAFLQLAVVDILFATEDLYPSGIRILLLLNLARMFSMLLHLIRFLLLSLPIFFILYFLWLVHQPWILSWVECILSPILLYLVSLE